MRDTIYRDDAIRVASGFCHPANVAKELEKLPSAEPDCSDCIKYGGDWDCDHMHCHKGSDLISRQAAIDAVNKNRDAVFRNSVDYEGILYDISNQPTAQQWIPCSERLPGDDEEVIVTIYDDSGDSAFSYTTVGWHFKGLWVVDNERCLRVVAWCKLPKPYKGGDADG